MTIGCLPPIGRSNPIVSENRRTQGASPGRGAFPDYGFGTGLQPRRLASQRFLWNPENVATLSGENGKLAMSGFDDLPECERLLAAERHLKTLVPGAVLVGGTAAVLRPRRSTTGSRPREPARPIRRSPLTTRSSGWLANRPCAKAGDDSRNAGRDPHPVSVSCDGLSHGKLYAQLNGSEGPPISPPSRQGMATRRRSHSTERSGFCGCGELTGVWRGGGAAAGQYRARAAAQARDATRKFSDEPRRLRYDPQTSVWLEA